MNWRLATAYFIIPGFWWQYFYNLAHFFSFSIPLAQTLLPLISQRSAEDLRGQTASSTWPLQLVQIWHMTQAGPMRALVRDFPVGESMGKTAFASVFLELEGQLRMANFIILWRKPVYKSQSEAYTVRDREERREMVMLFEVWIDLLAPLNFVVLFPFHLTIKI